MVLASSPSKLYKTNDGMIVTASTKLKKLNTYLRRSSASQNQKSQLREKNMARAKSMS